MVLNFRSIFSGTELGERSRFHLNLKGFLLGVRIGLGGLISAHALHTIGVGVIFHMTYF